MSTTDSPSTGPAMGIDYGLRRIGLALSDSSWTLASPLATLTRRRGKRAPIAAILEVAARHGVGTLVVGLPLELDGGDSDWTEEVRSFAGKLRVRSGLVVELHDERFSSVAAESKIRSIGLPKKKKENKARIDAAAATIILQGWLDSRQTG